MSISATFRQRSGKKVIDEQPIIFRLLVNIIIFYPDLCLKVAYVGHVAIFSGYLLQTPCKSDQNERKYQRKSYLNRRDFSMLLFLKSRDSPPCTHTCVSKLVECQNVHIFYLSVLTYILIGCSKEPTHEGAGSPETSLLAYSKHASK